MALDAGIVQSAVMSNNDDKSKNRFRYGNP